MAETHSIQQLMLAGPGVYHGPFKSEKGCTLFELHYYKTDEVDLMIKTEKDHLEQLQDEE